MTGGLIFKTEMYKFFTDKFYLISAAVLGVLNIIETVFLINIPYMSDGANGIVGFMVLLLVILIFANIFFMFIFPFHMVSVDYKNNVMALMMASGVNRTKLYFSKIGAILLCSLIMSAILFLIPFIILLVFIYSQGGSEIFSQIFYALFHTPELPIFTLILTAILGMINSVVMVLAAAILLKGSNLTFLVFIGFNMGASFITNFFSVLAMPLLINGSPMAFFAINILLELISIAGFGALGFIMMRKQNL